MDTTVKNSLLIIDNEENQKLFKSVLDREYHIYATNNGASGIRMAKEYQPDLVLLGITISGMDGYEVLTVLKALEATRKIPVIITSGLNTSDKKAKGLVAADYIGMPFDTELIRLKVQAQMQIVNTIDLLPAE